MHKSQSTAFKSLFPSVTIYIPDKISNKKTRPKLIEQVLYTVICSFPLKGQTLKLLFLISKSQYYKDSELKLQNEIYSIFFNTSTATSIALPKILGETISSFPVLSRLHLL